MNFQSFSKSRRDRFMNRPSNFADRPSGRKFRLQLGPWRHGRWWELNSGEGKARLGRERSGDGRGAHRGSICGRRRGGKALGGGLRRWPAVPAAGASAPARWTARLAHWRPGKVVWCCVELLGRWLVVVGSNSRNSPWASRADAASACAWAAGCVGLNSRPAPYPHDEGARRLNSPAQRRPR
jgi:hypothetical protein